MPRFTVLTHDFPFWHWDLLLEVSAAHPGLRTWRLRYSPDQPGAQRAESLPDHRRIYLDYEGPVSGNRGEVHRWDTGEFTVLSTQLNREELRLAGEKLRGTLLLTHDPQGEWSVEFRCQPNAI